MTLLLAFLAPGSLNHTANIIKGFAIAIGIAIAVGFVWLWWSHRVRERQQELSARAHAIHVSSLRAAIQYPELAEPVLGAISSPADIVRYKQFVAALLGSANEILLLDPSPFWRAALARQLMPHRSYLTSEEFRSGPWGDCTPDVQAVIRQATGG